MRAYFFGNMYLSPIQQGIQAAHVVHDLFVKYPKNVGAGKFLWDWARDHKTMILLNGGYADTLRSIIELFEFRENEFPWTSFNEGKDSLDGALTSVGIVLPEKIYLLAKQLQGPKSEETREDIYRGGMAFIEGLADEPGHPYMPTQLSAYELSLADELNKYRLA